MARSRCTIAAFLALYVLGIALSGCSLPALSRPSLVDNGAVIAREPAAAATFIDAYAHGDLRTSDDAASPLYRAEWIRRGTTRDQRFALLPAYFRAPVHPSEWLQFSYVGGLVDDVGFGHLLYTAHSTGGTGDAAPTVWRVDVGPDGSVIWTEMVYLFSEDTSDVTSVEVDGAPARASVPPQLRSFQDLPLVGVHTTRGQEGYYAVASRPTATPNDPHAVHSYVFFFAVDPDGHLRAGAWSYGKPQPGLSRTARSTRVNLSADQSRLLRAYLDTIP